MGRLGGLRSRSREQDTPWVALRLQRMGEEGGKGEAGAATLEGVEVGVGTEEGVVEVVMEEAVEVEEVAMEGAVEGEVAEGFVLFFMFGLTKIKRHLVLAKCISRCSSRCGARCNMQSVWYCNTLILLYLTRQCSAASNLVFHHVTRRWSAG